MNYLAFVLFIPWFAILAFAYWHLPRDLPRSPGRYRFDLGALLISFAAAAYAAHLSMSHPWLIGGPIWPQVVAVLTAYASFLILMLLAFTLRRLWWRSPHH